MNETKWQVGSPFDARPVPSAGLTDLDRRRFEDEYLEAAFASNVPAANARTYEQNLAAAKMVVSADEPTPTVLGVLVLSPRTRDFLPGAYVQFLRIAGCELADPVSNEQAIDGTIAEVLRRTDEKLSAHNRTAVDFTSGPRERRTSLYPMPALRQLVRNAILHRSYEATNVPVRVTWFDDRIEILSPGGPFGTVTVENFGEPGVCDYRNPCLAETLRILGFVRRLGVGIATARRALNANGNPPPEFVVNSSYVCVTLRPVP